MARKKKYLLIFSFILFVALFGFTLENSCNAYTSYNGAPQLKVEEMEQIIEKISMDNIFSGDVVSTITSTFNTWARTRRAVEEFYLENIIFFRYNSTSQRFISWALGNGTYSGSLPYLYVGPNNVSNYLTTTSNNIVVKNFSDWVYDANNNKTSVTTSATTFYYIDLGNPSLYYSSTAGATVITNDKNGTRQNITISTTSGGVPTLYIPNLLTFAQPYTITSYTQDYGRNYYFLTNNLILENESLFPTPTPTPSAEPTSEPTGGGGGGTSVDLTETNNKIDDVNQNLEIIEQKIPDSGEIATIIDNGANSINNTLTGDVDLDNISVTSGDIIDALGFTLMEDPYSNFWYTLTQNLNASLTSSVRTFTFESPFDRSTITINLDDYPVNLPETIQWLITTITVYFLVMIIMRYFHDIYVLITSGNVDEVLAMNEESGIVDLF